MPHPPQELYDQMAIKGEKRRLGFSGERKAARYLKRHGCKILARNYRCPFGEVDIIVQDEEGLAFVEVKTRTDDSFGLPNEAVNKLRQERYKNCVRYYFKGRQIDCTVRFDVVEIFKGKVNHIKNAFY